MPWGPSDATRHTRKANSAKRRRQWADVADSELARTGDDAAAIRAADAVVNRSYSGQGRKGHTSKARTGKSRSWVGR